MCMLMLFSLRLYHRIRLHQIIGLCFDAPVIRRAQVKVGLINLCKGLFSLNARIYYKLKSGT